MPLDTNTTQRSVPFDAREATIATIHQALFSHTSTSREIVSAFLSRIEAFNSKINAVIALNQSALAEADALDKRIANGETSGSLFGVPILLKDNFDTADMKTTGGCAALQDMQPSVDAPTVIALRDAGAIILGKANLHELALEGLSTSSLGGQAINPYDFTRTPGGSSGGSGAAIAASFAVLATGTDTVNSLRSPASANSLFSVRPTRGLISRSGVIPVSHTQDTVGPIGRCVNDIATALTIMASVGQDIDDDATASCPLSARNLDYASDLQPTDLSTLRLGVITTFFNRDPAPETTSVNSVVDKFFAKLQGAGASLIPITQEVYTSTEILRTCDTQRYELRDSLNKYLSRSELSGTFPRTMEDLYSIKSKKYLVIPAQYEYITTALDPNICTTSPSYAQIRKNIARLTSTLHQTFSTYNLDALIYPQQSNLVVRIGCPSQSGRNGILAAVTGFPVVTVPAGFSEVTEEAPIGVPVGLEIMGRPWSEKLLLKIAKGFEGLGSERRTPKWAEECVDGRNYKSVPIVGPEHGTVLDTVYPLGKTRSMEG